MKNCYATMNGGTKGQGFINGTVAISHKGARMCDGRYMLAGFSAIFPPNSVSCQHSDNLEMRMLRSASSNHSGGVNCALFDGSVRFVSDTVDCGSYTSPHPLPYSGNSIYGVWGAMGSADGGEAKSL